MAGRPKTTAKTVTDLELRMHELVSDLVYAIPDMYLDEDEPRMEPCRSWRCALDAALAALDAMETLGALVRARAGIPEVGTDTTSAIPSTPE